MKNRGLVVAADRSVARLAKVRENISRLGLDVVRPVAEDACNASTLSAPLAERFDRILVDAPCSSTGVLGRRPDARWRRTESDLRPLAEIQLAILNSAFRRLRPEGILVYSTCSLEVEENELVIDAFVKTTPSAVLEPASSVLPGIDSADTYLTALPGRHSGDGAFAARLKKAAS